MQKSSSNFLVRLSSIIICFAGQYEPLAAAAPLAKVRMGVVLADSTSLAFDSRFIVPALELAASRALALYNVAIEPVYFLFPGTECRVSFALPLVVKALNDSVDFIVGPACSEDVTDASKLATIYNTILITGSGSYLNDTSRWDNNFRTAFNIGTQSAALLAVCGQFNWTRVIVIYDVEVEEHAATAQPLIDYLRKNKRSPYDYPVKGSELTGLSKADAILHDASLQARIVLFLISPRKIIRHFLTQAHRRGMCNGDYAFFMLDPFKTDFLSPSPQNDVMDDFDATSQCYALFILSLRFDQKDPAFKTFAQQVRDHTHVAVGAPPPEVNYYSATFHDAVLVYAVALNETIQEGRPGNNVDYMGNKMVNRTFAGCIGPLYMDPDGDRAADFELYQTIRREATSTETTPAFVKVAQFIGSRAVYEPVKPIQWLNAANTPVINRPPCDYDGNDPVCLNAARTTLGGALAGSFLIVFLSGFGGLAIYRYIHWRKELNNLDWLAAWEEIYIHQRASSAPAVPGASIRSEPETTEITQQTQNKAAGDGVQSMQKLNAKSNHSLQKSYTTKESSVRGNTTIASFHSTLTMMRLCPGAHVPLSSDLRAEVRVVKALACESLLKFIAACIEPEHVTVLGEYCSRGTLQDVLQNDAVALDWVFRISFINDIVSAMLYLQASPIVQHGRLTSRSCFIDKRFLLKVGDYGLPSFYDGVKTPTEPGDLLWTAPEILRAKDTTSRQSEASSEGDVFAFAIILSEIILRESPYFLNNTTVDEVVKKVERGERPMFRPIVQDSFCQEEIMLMMRSCWAEDPVERPKFAQIRGSLRNLSKTNGRQRENIIDTLIERMEQYAASLEVSVDEKTHALVEEKKKTEQLLYSILPRAVAEQLKRGEAVLPESYDSVTIYFGDIVEFTTLSAASSPNDIVTLMNDLYCRFDEIIATFDAYKVETIGDCYVIVSGLPHRNGQQHAGEIARMALTLRETMSTFQVRHLPEKRLQLRIGLNSGPCVAGVVGFATPRYCLFGDTVNVAARMESTGEAMKIQITQTTEIILRFLGSFQTELRGVVQIKGKGEMQTYWLTGFEPN
ncbi:Atrial natriuretic peptide receptor 2 [Hypsibius exemplaris]|uniref:Guanylate cyclase n=1 Tax=Hypsibius exemplaris TaxID=2072580 RepID=A0A9X6NE40_HYPEX|nr:Atrial natriuretic peptide receptor 2 [Hypsibius exemplaris]